MWLRGIAAAGLAALTGTAPLLAQSTGTLELGGFGRYTMFSDVRSLDDQFGIGGRLGLFVTPRFSLEVDASYAGLDGPAGTDWSYFPVHGRLLINQPLTQSLDLILGGGGVWNRFSSDDSDIGVGGLVGTRIHLSPRTALRLDATVDHMPSGWNSGEVTVTNGFGGNVEVQFGSTTHWGFQAGLSLFLARQPPALAPAPAPAAPTPPTPPAAQPPPPPPPPANDAARAREIIAERVHFDFDRYEIRPDGQQVLDRKLEVLRANPAVRLIIEGHCDERGSLEYNLALGQRRANAVRDYLVAHGIDAARLETVSYGEERPLDPRSNEDAWALNRRAEFIIAAGGDDLRMP